MLYFLGNLYEIYYCLFYWLTILLDIYERPGQEYNGLNDCSWKLSLEHDVFLTWNVMTPNPNSLEELKLIHITRSGL